MIYLLEDDDSIRELIIYTLGNQGMEALGFAEPSSFWKAMKEKLPDLLLLDIMLPGEDGISILKKLRLSRETEKLPVIMLTAKGSEYDTVYGLDCGADDYISKPFRIMELLSRIKALLRRTNTGRTKPENYSVGSLTVSPEKHLVEVDGEKIDLTLKEYELLCLLMSKPGIVFERETLLKKIWGYDFDGESRTLDVHIRTLRQKLKSAGKLIETVRGVGYKAAAPSQE